MNHSFMSTAHGLNIFNNNICFVSNQFFIKQIFYWSFIIIKDALFAGGSMHV